MTLRSVIPASLVALLAILLLLLQHAWSERDRARRSAVAAEARTVVAEAQVRLGAASAQTIEAAQTRELHITLQAKEAADEIRHAQGADAPVPADVLAGWAGAVDRLREPPARDTRAAELSGG